MPPQYNRRGYEWGSGTTSWARRERRAAAAAAKAAAAALPAPAEALPKALVAQLPVLVWSDQR